MGRTISPKMSWLFTLFCIAYFPTFGMHSVENTQIDNTYNLEKLREEFIEILKTQPEFIYLNSTESQYNATNGTYKRFPYYQKISQEPLTLVDSRFTIQKHVITGQWQLTEVFDYYWSKNIKAFPVTEENENNALLHNQSNKSTYTNSHTIDELNKTIFNANMEVESKNKSITSLTEQNEILMALVDKQCKELSNQRKIVQELESILIKNENEICDSKREIESILFVNKKQISELSKMHNSKLIEKQNEICNISQAQTQLKSNLIEKEHKICDIFKNENKLQSTLLEKTNEIRNLENQIQRYKKITNASQNKIKSMQAVQNCSKISDLKNEIDSSRDDCKQIEKEKQISDYELLKFQELYEKLKFEKATWEKKEMVLTDQINDHETIIKQLTEKLQKLDKIIMLETSPRELNNSEKKEIGNKNKSQIEDNEKFTKGEDHASRNNLDNKIDSIQNVALKEFLIEVKKKTQKCEPTIKKNHESLKLEKCENKKTLKNEDNSTEIPESIKLETNDTKVNLGIKTVSLKNDKKTIKKKFTKNEPENLKNQNWKTTEFGINQVYVETVIATQTLKVKSKEEKQIQRKNEKKQNKILNAIEEILLKLMPTTNEKGSVFYKKLVAGQKSERENEISLLLQQLKKSGDDDLMSKIKFYLENKDTLIMGTDPKYQYESLFANIGVIHHAYYMKKPCSTYSSCKDYNYREYRNFVVEWEKLYEKHKRIFDNMLESLKDEKLKIKVKCFREKDCLFNSQQYEYENFFRTIGYIVYGYGNNVQEESLQLENQILKNETISLESDKSVVLEKKQNFGNQTNVEEQFLETPPIDLDTKLIESKQMEHEENEAKSFEPNENTAIKEKQMLNRIEEILYKSGPFSLIKKESSQFNEMFAGKMRGEYISRVSKLLQDLINTKDPQMISNIQYFLETKEFFSAHTLFQYEFILMNHGSMIYNSNILTQVDTILKSDDFSKVPEDKKNDFKKHYPAIEKLYKYHEKIVVERFKALIDEKMKLKIESFIEKRCLYDLPQNKYEYFIMTIGIIVYGCGGHLEEL